MPTARPIIVMMKTMKFDMSIRLLTRAVAPIATKIESSARMIGRHAATTAPNFVRGSLVLTTALFHALAVHVSLPNAALIVGVIVLGGAFLAVRGLDETYGKDLDFVEH